MHKIYLFGKKKFKFKFYFFIQKLILWVLFTHTFLKKIISKMKLNKKIIVILRLSKIIKKIV